MKENGLNPKKGQGLGSEGRAPRSGEKWRCLLPGACFCAGVRKLFLPSASWVVRGLLVLCLSFLCSCPLLLPFFFLFPFWAPPRWPVMFFFFSGIPSRLRCPRYHWGFYFFQYPAA